MKHKFMAAAVLIALAGLAGCSVGPQYREPASAPIHLASPEAGAFGQMQVRAPWWSFLRDERLTQLIAKAMDHNHDIAQSEASLLAARAIFDERQLDRLPIATSQAGYQRSIMQQAAPQDDAEPTRQRTESYRIGFDAQWEIDLFGRLKRLAAGAQARAQAAQAELRQIRLTVAADTARAYYEALGLRQRLKIAQAQIRSWRETERLVLANVSLGSGRQEDLENARSNLRLSEAAVPPLKSALQAAYYRLDVLTGQRPGQTEALARQAAAAPLSTRLPLGDVNLWIRSRPDVQRVERLLAASTEDVGAATAELYPRLTLGGFIGFFALRGTDLGAASRAFDFTPGLTWPALNLGSARARLRGAEAGATGALARYEQSLLQAQEDVENAVTRVVQHQQRLAALLQAAHHGSAALRIANTRYRAGAGTYLAVLENQRALFQLQQEAARAETESYVNVIALYKALGWGTGAGAGAQPSKTATGSP